MLQPYDTTNSAVTPARPQPDSVILPAHLERELDASGRRNVKSALKRYAEWLASTGRNWTGGNLADYRAHLELHYQLAPQTINNHLSLIRGRYNNLLETKAANTALRQQAAAYLEGSGQDASAANVKAAVDMLKEDLQAGLSKAHNAPAITKQDRPDSDFVRLTKEQADKFLMLPDRSTLPGLRDAAMIALMLATGIREQELCNLEAGDLKQIYKGELALLVRKGKGAKQRMIPYGGLDGCLVVVDAWLKRAGITEGPVFRGFYKAPKEGDPKLRPGKITNRQVNNILAQYPIMLDGRLVTIKPHDCRRTYARLLWTEGVKLEAIQKNLGHADPKTTQHYIGIDELAKHRRPPVILNFGTVGR